MSSPLTEAYVFAQRPAGNPVLAGKLAITRTSGTFAYSEQWLEESWAYPLDPVNLKLTSGSGQHASGRVRDASAGPAMQD